MKISHSILLVIALTSLAACSSPKTVRNMADKKNLTLGVAIQAGDMYDPASMAFLKENFNLIVPENTFKWKLIRPSLKFWNWSDMDKMVAFAEENKIKVKGHNFLWHQQNPPYVDGLKNRDDAIGLLTEHITTIMTRYKGRIWEYDVANEVLNEDGTMRDTVWLRTIGPDYLDIAFKTAREADPKARLLLNDYNNEYAGTAKGDGFYTLVKDLKNRGIPIDGVGLQLHTMAQFAVDEANLRKNIQRFNELGLFVSFTEIDVRIKIPSTDKKAKEQATAYKKLMEIALSEVNAGSFIVWGYTDAKSWIPAAFGGYGDAHLFDREIKPKPVWAELQTMLAEAKARKKR